MFTVSCKLQPGKTVVAPASTGYSRCARRCVTVGEESQRTASRIPGFREQIVLMRFKEENHVLREGPHLLG